MSNPKRIQTLTNFILHLQQHNHIPEIKKQIELLQTALQTLKDYSNDKTVLKSTLLVMKQTVDLINKYNLNGDTGITDKETYIKKRIEAEHRKNTIRNTERVNDEELESNGSIDPRYDGSIEVGGDIGRNTRDEGGENLSPIQNCTENNLESTPHQNYTEKIYQNSLSDSSTTNLTNLPPDATLHLNDILQRFRKQRDEINKEEDTNF